MTRERALDAVDVLNDFIGDFITGERTFQDFAGRLRRREIPLETFVPIQRMCISHVALAFAKFEEFREHYHDLVPPDWVSRRNAATCRSTPTLCGFSAVTSAGTMARWTSKSSARSPSSRQSPAGEEFATLRGCSGRTERAAGER